MIPKHLIFLEFECWNSYLGLIKFHPQSCSAVFIQRFFEWPAFKWIQYSAKCQDQTSQLSRIFLAPRHQTTLYKLCPLFVSSKCIECSLQTPLMLRER